jgi:hypothetical protein
MNSSEDIKSTEKKQFFKKTSSFGEWYKFKFRDKVRGKTFIYKYFVYKHLKYLN